MSKIYNKYIELKKNELDNKKTLYLFRYGIFFIFIDGDAKIASEHLNLKLSQLNDKIVKCRFPNKFVAQILKSFQKTSI